MIDPVNKWLYKVNKVLFTMILHYCRYSRKKELYYICNVIRIEDIKKLHVCCAVAGMIVISSWVGRGVLGILLRSWEGGGGYIPHVGCDETIFEAF
jgi:hypothetical protein